MTLSELCFYQSFYTDWTPLITALMISVPNKKTLSTSRSLITPSHYQVDVEQ